MFSVADCYWVGKASLRSWKRLAMEKLKEKEAETVTNVNGNNHNHQGTNYIWTLAVLFASPFAHP